MDLNYLSITAFFLLVALCTIGCAILSRVREARPSIRCAERDSNEEMDPEEAKIRIEKQLQRLMHREAALREQLVHLNVVERLTVGLQNEDGSFYIGLGPESALGLKITL